MTLSVMFRHKYLILNVEMRLVVLKVDILGYDKGSNYRVFNSRRIGQPLCVCSVCGVLNLLHNVLGAVSRLTAWGRFDELLDRFKITSNGPCDLDILLK